VTIALESGFPISSDGGLGITITPTTAQVGDLYVVNIQMQGIDATTAITAASDNVGQVTTWTRAGYYLDTTNNIRIEQWHGIVTGNTGAGTTVTFTFTGTTPSNYEYVAYCLTAGLGAGTPWRVVGYAGKANTTSTNVTWANVNSDSTTPQAFIGGGETANWGTYVSVSAGFTGFQTVGGHIGIYDLNLTASTGYAPVAVNGSTVSTTLGVIYSAAAAPAVNNGNFFMFIKDDGGGPPSSLGYTFGLNGTNEIQWAPTSSYPSTIAALTALGAKVSRQQLWYNNLTVAAVQPYYLACQAAGIQLLIVVAPIGPGPGGVAGANPQTLSAQPAFANALAAIATACPGIWWEIGNELDYNSPGLASTYVPFFSACVTALHAADSTCKVGPSPIANINGGGSGMTWQQTLVTNGLAAVPYDFTPIHWYQGPGNLPPRAPWYAGPPPGIGGTTPWESYVTTCKAQFVTWGITQPVWLTETGWQPTSGDTGDGYPDTTQALIATYMVEWLTDLNSLGIPVVIPYALYDSGGEQFGWMNVTNYETSSQAYTARPVYTAVQALL